MSWLDLAPDRDYDDSRFNQDVEGSNYTFRTIYNARRDAWTLVVLDSDDNVVATAPSSLYPGGGRRWLRYISRALGSSIGLSLPKAFQDVLYKGGGHRPAVIELVSPRRALPKLQSTRIFQSGAVSF